MKVLTVYIIVKMDFYFVVGFFLFDPFVVCSRKLSWWNRHRICGKTRICVLVLNTISYYILKAILVQGWYCTWGDMEQGEEIDNITRQ